MENVPALVGLGAACEALLTDDRLADRGAPTAGASPTGVLAAAPRPRRRAASTATPIDRLPHLVCLGIDGIEPQAVLLGLDQAGIAAHSGSACASEALEPSPVLEAMGVDAHRSLRLSVGWRTTDADIDALLAPCPDVIDRLRALGSTA